MPKRKKPLTSPEFEWVAGRLSVGEIVMEMAENIALELVELRRGGVPNQLANLAKLSEIQERRAEAIRQINRAFALQVETELRQAKAGSHQQKHGGITRDNVRKCVDSLRTRMKNVSAPNVEGEWSRLKLGICPSQRRLRDHIKALRDGGT